MDSFERDNIPGTDIPHGGGGAPLLSREELEILFERSKKELMMLSEITNAIMQSLELDQVLYTILTALTSHEGLCFNRAIFFLVNEKNKTLEGRMAIGPHSAEEADKIWRHIENNRLTMQDLIDSYDKFKKDPESKLNQLVKGITIPLREDMGILALTILEGMPFEINSEEARSLVNDDIKKILNMDLFVTVPLKTRNKTLGAILVDNLYTGTPITKNSVRILNMFADHAALAIENSKLYERTVYLSKTDWLTGLWNTRHFNDVLDEKLLEASGSGTPLGLLLIDVDNFKRYNDSLGHQEGDRAIKRIADILKRFSRKSDFVCRYGGEEFCVIMSKTGKNEAQIIAERLRSEIESSFKHDDSVPEKLTLTISWGLAIYPSDSGEKKEHIRKADTALYTAKRLGKNRTCLFSDAMAKDMMF
ncbi:MAG: diguanylate cyclase [Candidatus Omnitrophica bacterium]|nr:diguanylate cyclase [Candidatus Omnitrophota bacterium]